VNRTKIKISKLEGVRRQVETAIRIYFVNGDPVSVHTLAAASLQVLVADRDPDKILEFPLAMPELFLWECVAKYPELTDETPLLMHAYRIWFLIHHSDILKAEFQAQVNFLRLSTDFPENDRARFFEYILPILAKNVMAEKG
jgi:hypothetical protein